MRELRPMVMVLLGMALGGVGVAAACVYASPECRSLDGALAGFTIGAVIGLLVTGPLAIAQGFGGNLIRSSRAARAIWQCALMIGLIACCVAEFHVLEYAMSRKWYWLFALSLAMFLAAVGLVVQYRIARARGRARSPCR